MIKFTAEMPFTKAQKAHIHISESDNRNYEAAKAVAKPIKRSCSLLVENLMEALLLQFSVGRARIGIAEVMGSNPVGASAFFLGFLYNGFTSSITARITCAKRRA